PVPPLAMACVRPRELGDAFERSSTSLVRLNLRPRQLRQTTGGGAMSERTRAQLLAENKRLRAEVERLDRIVNPPPPEPPEEPAPKPRLYVLALGELEKRIVPNAFQIPRGDQEHCSRRRMGTRLSPQRPASWRLRGEGRRLRHR